MFLTKQGHDGDAFEEGMIMRNTPVEIVAHNFKLFMEAAELEK